ncbi:hypothetical protein H7X64_05015 [Armatimonadetes bacterium]|nr:hypothetical protein [bacterium]
MAAHSMLNFYIHIRRLTIIIPGSNRMEKKNEGIVIFVGNAARFVTSGMPIAAIAIPQNHTTASMHDDK